MGDVTEFPEGRVASVAHNNMVNDLNLEQLASTNHFPRGSEIRITRLGIAARMIVHQKYGMCRRHYSGAKKFTWVRKCLIQKTNRDNLMPQQSLSSVEQENCYAFAVGVEVRGGGDVPPPVVDGALR